ncbi:MAG TPA: hypothetical protein VGL81_29545 [Polyangiaceae bacterium]|jgi:hypothetical protein
MRPRRLLPSALLAALFACNGDADPPVAAVHAAPSASSSTALSSPSVSTSPSPSPPPTPAPPLSPRRAAALAADVAARSADLRSSLGPSARIQTVADLFILVARDPSAPLDAVASLIQRAVDALYAGPFSHRPDRSVVVWVFPSEGAFEQAVSAATGLTAEPKGLGIYDPTQRLVLARPDGSGNGSYLHEISHPLEIADFPHAPAWIAEGIPAQLEVVDWSKPGEIHGKAHFRLQTLRDTLAGKDRALAASVNLDAVFAMTDPVAFHAGPEYLRYACSREALRWLDSMGKMWKFYSLFRDSWLEDKTGVAAFTEVVGKSPADATADWIRWINSREAEGAAP